MSQLLPPNCCHRAAPNVASQMLPATTRRRRDDDDATTTTRRCGSGDGAGESPLQPPGALTVAAAPSQSLQPLRAQSPISWAPCSPGSRCSPLTPHSVAAAPRRPSVTSLHPSGPSQSPGSWAPCSPSSRCSPQLPLTVAAAPHAVTVAAASRASLLLFTPDPRGWVRIAVRIEVGRDDDEGTTTGAGGVSRAVRIAVRIEAERDDDDAATTTWIVDSFLWLPLVATVCGYRLWLPMWLPMSMWLQPPGALTVSPPGALTVAAAPQAPSQSLQPPKCPSESCSPPGALTIAAAPQVPLRVLQPPRRPHNRCSPKCP